jgi:uncharacterized membrane protein YfcA
MSYYRRRRNARQAAAVILGTTAVVISFAGLAVVSVLPLKVDYWLLAVNMAVLAFLLTGWAAFNLLTRHPQVGDRR